MRGAGSATTACAGWKVSAVGSGNAVPGAAIATYARAHVAILRQFASQQHRRAGSGEEAELGAAWWQCISIAAGAGFGFASGAAETAMP